MHELDRVKTAWNVLKSMQSRNTVDELTQRARVAEAIRDAYKAGITRREISDALDIVPSRVTALVNGNYRPGPGSRKLPTAPEWSPEVQARVTTYLARVLPADAGEGAQRGSAAMSPEEVPAISVCRYCGKEAKYKVEYGHGKMHYVCQEHKP